MPREQMMDGAVVIMEEDVDPAVSVRVRSFNV